MKRDMDLAREILLDVEECGQTDGSGYLKLAYDDHVAQEVTYHVKLLEEAGLLEIRDQSKLNGLQYYPTRLTWAGHEFLDAARDDSRWRKAKRLVIEKAGSLSFELLKRALMKLWTENTGLMHSFP
jgi:DNA-binding transcriptional ArsR family regulator